MVRQVQGNFGRHCQVQAIPAAGRTPGTGRNDPASETALPSADLAQMALSTPSADAIGPDKAEKSSAQATAKRHQDIGPSFCGRPKKGWQANRALGP